LIKQRIQALLLFTLLLSLLQNIPPVLPTAFATTTTYAPNQATTWTIPSGVTVITVTAYGGGAGLGATDGAGNDARSPGARGKVIATFSVTTGQTIGIYPGNRGSNGATGSNTAGGSGGTDTDPNADYSGGNGGRSGTTGSSGSGGGGGAASTLYIDGTLSMVAGGSGGGGGSANVKGSAVNGYDTTSQITNQTTGGVGIQTTTACTASNDGGGGGGGGGGRWGSSGGGVYVTGGECAGYGGYRGNNFVVGTATSPTNTTDASGTSSGSIEITYVSAQTISISSLGTVSKTFPYLQTLSITTTGYSGIGAITFAIASGGTASGCALSSSASNAQISATSNGTCLITATIASDSNYNSATSAAATFTFNKANQSALSLSSTSGTYLTNLRLLSSGGNDTGTVSFAVSSVGTAGCSISNSDSLTSTSAGSCQVVATKAATNNYFAAYDTQTVTLGKASLTLTSSVTGSSTVKYGSSAVTSYTTNRSLGTGNIANISGTVSYSTVSSTACSIDSSTGVVLMTAAAGACSVRVSLASDPNYLDTNSTAISLTAAKADTLTVTASAVNLTYTGDSQTVSYQYSISGLKFSDALTALSYNYSGTTNSGAFTSGSANVNQAGVYTITPSAATISNSDSYTAVTYATGALTVNRATRTITGSSVASVKYGSQESVTVTTSPVSSSDGR
jgi:hypothetical protein